MRAANVVVVVLGAAAVGSAVWIAWRWWRLPLLAQRVRTYEAGEAARDGLRTLAALTAAGIFAGALVPGLGGRLVMRVLAGTSGPRSQGAVTDADEIVGEITTGGTVAVVVFVGVFAGLLAALLFIVVRRWLPDAAGPAGIIVGVLLLGTVGVADAISPDNRDFTLLEPTWLAVTLVTLTALLFGVTFTALAARLDAGLPMMSRRPASIAAHAALVVFVVPPLFLCAAVYVVGRAISRGRVEAIVEKRAAQRVGHVAMGGATALAVVSSANAIAEILSG